MISTKTLDLLPESELIKNIKKGDSKSLDKLLDIYIPQLTAFFRYIHVPEDFIEDLTQETFEKVIKKIDSYDENKKFSTWLMTIGKNLYIDQYRKNNKNNEILYMEKQEDTLSDPEKEAISNLSLEELLKSLNDKERFIIEMRVFQKMPFAEIAEITGENDASLRSRFFRVINRLKNILYKD